VRRLHAIDPLFEAAEHGGPSVTHHGSSVRAARLQQVPFAARFRVCTGVRARSMPSAKRASRVPSTFFVQRDKNKTPRRNSVVIADRNPVFLRGLASILQTEGNFVVVASCQDEAECIASIRALSPSLAVLDMSLSELSGLKILAAVRTGAFPTRVVFLSSFATAAAAARAVSMGASGILPKDGAPQSLVRWLRQVMSGQRPGPLAVRNARRSRMRGKPEEQVIALTARERQIMELVSTGLLNREVGKRLRISEGTIKVHMHHIFQKLSIRNRTALANIGRMPESMRPQKE
jgi:two-component system nitrate/nitrite response regulator NarL